MRRECLVGSRKLLSCLGASRLTSPSVVQRNITSIPYVVEGEGNSERHYDIYSRLLKDRIICLMGQGAGVHKAKLDMPYLGNVSTKPNEIFRVDDRLSAAVTAQLLFLQSQAESKTIYMYINSPGGQVTSGLAIYDTMQYVSCPVSTFCIGQASSMGSLLLAAGAPGARVSLPHSRIMVHQPSGQAQGQASDIKIHAEEILKTREILNGIMAAHTGQSLEVIEAVMDRDRFMNAEEAKEFGIIDKVVKARVD